MASNHYQSPNTSTTFSPLYDVSNTRFSTPEQNLINMTYRDLGLANSSTSACTATPLNTAATGRSMSLSTQSTGVEFLASFGEDVQKRAVDEGIREENFHRLADSDLNRLHPMLSVQFDLRDLRDTKKLDKMSMAPVDRLHPNYTIAKIDALQVDTDTRMTPEERRRVTRFYVRAVYNTYWERFRQAQVVADVISHVADSLAGHFPSMRDAESTKEKPTYGDLFVRYPIGGSVYDCFKNMNRGLNEQFRARKRKSTGQPAALPAPSNTHEDMVTELELAVPERADVILRETFEHRRKWVTQGGVTGPSIKDVLTKYPIFQRDLAQVSKEFDRCMGDGKAEAGVRKLQDMLEEIQGEGHIDRVEKLMKKMKLTHTTKILPHVLLNSNYTEVANQTGGVVGCLDSEKLYVCIHGGFSVEVPDLVSMLSYILQYLYILHINFPRQCHSFFNFLCAVFGDRTVKLSRTQKDILK